MNAHPSSTFGNLLRQYRLAAGLTQEDLAERSRLSLAAINTLERGVRRAPRKETVLLLAEALHLTPQEHARFEEAARGQRLTSGEPLAGGASRSVAPGFPLAGRQREVHTLEQHLAGDGPPLLLLAGEPGIGKTRLLREAAALARATGWAVLEGGCSRRGGQAPYTPLLEALEGSVRPRPAQALRAALEGCAWLVRVLPELAEQISPLFPEGPLPPEQERRLVFAAIARYLANIAGPVGTLLVLDDLQWAGADALDLLMTLLHVYPDPPVRVVGAYRDTDVRPQDPLFSLLADLARAGLAQQQEIGPLAPPEAAELISHLLADTPTARGALAAHLLERAGGVPFFLISCAQAIETGALATRAAAGSTGIPWDLRQCILQRVAALPQTAQEVLSVAAVAGRVVPGMVLLAAAQGPEQEVLANLDAVCQARLFVELGEDYQFAHDLIREVIAADLSAARRASLHRRVAEALERTTGATALEQLAYHYARADVREKAAVYLAQAGERAQTMYAHAEAEQAYQEYVQHLDSLGRQVESAQGRERLAAVQMRRSRFDAALEVLEAALETYRRVRDQEGQRRVLAQVAQIHQGRGTPHQGLAHFLPLLEPLRVGEATPGLVALEVGLAGLYFGTGRYPEQLAAAERAAQLARTVGEDRLLLRAYHGYSLALCMLERVEEALSTLEVHQHLAERLGDLGQLAHALNNRAGIAFDRGEFPASLRTLDRAVEAAEQLGDPTLLAQLLSSRSQVRFGQGDWHSARADAERALTLLEPIEQSWARSGALCILGQLELAQGQEQAERRLEEALTLAQQGGGDLEVQRGVQAALAERDLLQGRPASARARLEPLLDRTEHPELGVAQLLPLLAWAAVDLGEDAQAVALIALSFERAGKNHLLVEVEAYRMQARLCLRQQRWDEAQAALEEALSLCRAMPAPYAEARVLAVYGQLHQAKGESTLARERLEAALAILHQLGERLYVEPVEQVLVLVKRAG